MNTKNLLKAEVDIATGKSEKKVKKLNNELANTKQTLKKSTNLLKQNRGALMGVGFAALFGGMALKRMFSGALKSIFNTYKETMSATSEFNQMTNQLNGAWTFFKFTLVDALMQSGLFQTMIGFVIRLVTSIGEFTSKHPQITKVIGIFLVLGVVLSSIIMVMGQLGLAMLSFAMLEGVAVAPMLFTFIKIIGVVTIFIALIYLLHDVFTSNVSPIEKMLTSILVIFTGLFGIAVLLGAAISLPFIVGLTAVAVFITGLIMLSQHVGGIGNAFKALGVFVLAIFAALGDSLFEVIISPLRAIINLINAAIKGSNKFLGTNFKEITIPAFTLSKKVWEMRNNLLAQGDDTENQSFKEILKNKTAGLIPEEFTNLTASYEKDSVNNEILGEIKKLNDTNSEGNSLLEENNNNSASLKTIFEDKIKTGEDNKNYFTNFNSSTTQ